MPAEVLVVDSQAIDPAAIGRVVDALAAGDVVALPTETVYGLAAAADDERAIRKVFALKGRPADHALIVHVAGEEGAASVTCTFPKSARTFAARFWPGPLTLVLEKSAGLSALVTGGGSTVAVRAPRHPVMREIIRRLGRPICAPSANPYKAISPTRAEHVWRAFPEGLTLVVDAGASDVGLESTVLDLTGVVPRVLRPGAIGIDDLRAIDPRVEAKIESEAPSRSPGQDLRHYAPRAKLYLVDARETLAERARDAVLRGERVAVVTIDPLELDVAFAASLGRDPSAYARQLFSTLHEVDALGCDLVLVERVPCDPGWMAVRDRLARAAEADQR